MRILCDQMVKERFVSVLESEDHLTVARVRDRLVPDAADDTIAAYAAQYDWVILSADDDYVADAVPYGLLLYEDDPAPSAGEVRDAIREVDRAYDHSAAIREWVPDGWIS
jgi:hypothetical protein